MKYSYYPGCSLHGAAVDYQMSITAVCRWLAIELEEVENWNCCGATAAASEDQRMAMLLAARNLARCGDNELAVSCNACYLRLKQLTTKLDKYPVISDQIAAHLQEDGLANKLSDVSVKHLLQIFMEQVGLERVAMKVIKPLEGLDVVPYYGCQLVRPAGFDHSEQPTSLDQLLSALGANVLPFYRKTKCCGGALITTREDLALEMINNLMSEAVDRGAKAIVVTCPLCQLNLDAYQSKVNKQFGTNYEIPVIYFTQLMGIAFGFSKRQLGLDRGLVSAEKILSSYV